MSVQVVSLKAETLGRALPVVKGLLDKTALSSDRLTRHLITREKYSPPTFRYKVGT